MGLDDAKAKALSLLETAITELQSSPQDAREVAEDCSLGALRAKQFAKAAALALPTFFGPIGLVALPAETVALLRLMSTSALATGWAIGRTPSEHDFKLILGVWSGQLDIKGLALAKGGAVAAPAAGMLASAANSIGVHVSSSTLGSSLIGSSATSLSTLGQAYVPYAAKQLFGKTIANAFGRWAPILGPLICGGINVAVINSVMDASEEYYRAT
ncbi:hypothetical protein [Tahibacter caeni]|uniref:hypothetical protein n=1 Tax=Tahibacter caeni TaxID=1453545 RepID=UPI00214892FD|nr:hypothetical protein [Tahibacter caeni]